MMLLTPAGPFATSVVAFSSTDGWHWSFLSVVLTPSDPVASNSEEGPNECDIATLADGTTLMAVIRIDGGDGKLPGAARPALPRSWVVFKSPSQTRTTFSACSNHQRRRALWRPTATPTATSSAHFLTLQFSVAAGRHARACALALRFGEEHRRREVVAEGSHEAEHQRRQAARLRTARRPAGKNTSCSTRRALSTLLV